MPVAHKFRASLKSPVHTAVVLGEGDVVIGQVANKEPALYCLCFKQAREAHPIGEEVESYEGFAKISDSDCTIVFSTPGDVDLMIARLNKMKLAMTQ